MIDRTSQRGSAVVEFALVIPLVLVVLVATAELAVVGRTQLELVNAAREGARTAATVADPAQAAAAARRAMGDGGADVRVHVTRPHVVGAETTVTVAKAHRVGLPLLGGFTVELSARAVMRVER